MKFYLNGEHSPKQLEAINIVVNDIIGRAVQSTATGEDTAQLTQDEISQIEADTGIGINEIYGLVSITVASYSAFRS